jgi:hypothetical protein
MNWKGYGRTRSWTNLPSRTQRNHVEVSLDSRSPGRDLNPGSPAYKAGVLTSRPGRLVERVVLLSISGTGSSVFFRQFGSCLSIVA